MHISSFWQQLEWGPDGETILTATTAPRLRIGNNWRTILIFFYYLKRNCVVKRHCLSFSFRTGNGFKVWHYSGSLLHESMWPTGQELLQVIWQRYADGTFTEKGNI